MNTQRAWLLVLLLLAIAALVAGAAAAQGPAGTDPAGIEPAAPLAVMGTAFTYQGRLNDAGSPANGVYDFEFRLYDVLSGGSQVGSAQSVADVAVSGGLFTVTLDFGADAFNGQARWLKVAVKRDADAGYATLTPRVTLSPAPHALALPGLWTQQNATSPNLIGGYSGNSVSAGVIAATIGGGGAYYRENRITADYGTVGGGGSNTASGVAATVGGGYQNTASGYSATVGGGTANTASGSYATVGGGISNTASGKYATVPGGRQAVASHFGELAYASGAFAAAGDAQSSLYVLRRETGDSALTELFLDGDNDRITLAADRVMAFDILVVASHRYGGGSSAGYQVAGVIRNIGGATSFVGTPIVTVLGENVTGWDVQVVASDAPDALSVLVKGSADTSIRWVASVRTVEVGR